MGNPAQMAVLIFASTLLNLLAFTTIPLFCALISFRFLDHAEPPLENPLYPTAVVFGCALIVTRGCMAVFQCALTTIFVCCFRDKADYKSK
jgi:hypothetical protein